MSVDFKKFSGSGMTSDSARLKLISELKKLGIKNNKVLNNDTPNFAPEGNIVGKTPNGTGIMVMANEKVILEENYISGNATAGILVVSYLDEYEDDNYNPLPNKIFIRNNQLNSNGFDVDKVRAEPIALLTKNKAPEIIWDGVTLSLIHI